MIHMRSEIAQSLTWVPPKQMPWTLNLGFSCIGRGLKQSARSSEEVPAECGNQYESIFSQLTPTNLFPEFCILTLKLPLLLQCSIFPSNPNESPCGLPITNTCLLPAVVGARSSPKAAESLRAGAELNSAPPCLSRWWWWWSLRKIWLLLVWFLCNLHLIKLGDNIPSMEKPSSSSFTPKMIA